MINKIINKNFGTDNVITCDNLSVYAGPKKKQRIIINNFNYAFTKGKIYAIVGKSGAGKTTLINHFNGLLKSKQGNIFVKNNNILGKKKKIKNYKDLRKDVGIVFQFPETQIFKNTVAKDIAFGPINYHVNSIKVKQLVNQSIDLVGLDKKLLNVNPFELSNGQRRLVAIAGILALDTDIIIFDEPTAGLDPFYQNKIINLIKKLNKLGKTIIVITHNMDHVLELADQMLILCDGRLIKYGKPYDILSKPKLLNNYGLATPNVIQSINVLSKQNKKYKKLLLLQPKTLQELVNCIKKGEI